MVWVRLGVGACVLLLPDALASFVGAVCAYDPDGDEVEGGLEAAGGNVALFDCFTSVLHSLVRSQTGRSSGRCCGLVQPIGAGT